MAAKNASQRRTLLKALAKIKREVSALANHWNVPSTVYLSQKEREATAGSQGYHRDRRPEEYPEERAASWAYAYNTADELIKELTKIRNTAYDRYWEIKGVEADSSAGDA